MTTDDKNTSEISQKAVEEYIRYRGMYCPYCKGTVKQLDAPEAPCAMRPREAVRVGCRCMNCGMRWEEVCNIETKIIGIEAVEE